MSFFGGDHTKAHFSVNLPYRVHEKETRKEGEERRKAARERIHAAGFAKFESQYFQYSVSDEKGKVAAKKKAEKLAKQITKATGETVQVLEGCFL